MIRIGITGTLGAGKSTVAELFERWGALRIDADRLAREAVRPGSPGLAAIRRRWGAEVIDGRGELDRALMRRIVFGDPAERRRLEQIVHPEVRRLRERRLEEARAAGVAVVAEEVPLLYEAGLGSAFDAVVFVDAPVEERRERVRRQRDLAPEEFDAIEAAQWPAAEKRRHADHVLDNDGDRAALEEEARRVWERIVGPAAGAAPAGAAGAASDGPPGSAPGAAAGTTAAPSEEADWWTVDLHVHTCFSHDSSSSPEAVLRRAAEAGLDRVAITDHNEIDGAWAARELDPERVIVGEEVRTSEGLDLIGLFLAERIPRGLPFREVATEIRRQGGVTYLPHPFDRYRGAKPAFLAGVGDCVDLVEGFNARVHSRERNRRAAAWARERGLPLGAGSDAHLVREVGRGRLRLPPFHDPASFLAAARVGRIEGETSGHWVHLGSTWAKLRKRLVPQSG